jgi:hypothetical protein
VYIKLELEERANEEKFTIKKILEVKKKHKELEEMIKGKSADVENNAPSALDSFGGEDGEEVDKEDQLFDN